MCVVRGKAEGVAHNKDITSRLLPFRPNHYFNLLTAAAVAQEVSLVGGLATAGPNGTSTSHTTTPSGWSPN